MRHRREKAEERRQRTVMRKLIAALGALVCLVGLFYFVLMLTR